jgi:hypothetical protein
VTRGSAWNRVAAVLAILGLSTAASLPAAAAPAQDSTYVGFDVTNQSGMDAQDPGLDFAREGIVGKASFSGQFGDARTNPPDNDSVTFFKSITNDENATVYFSNRARTASMRRARSSSSTIPRRSIVWTSASNCRSGAGVPRYTASPS